MKNTIHFRVYALPEYYAERKQTGGKHWVTSFGGRRMAAEALVTIALVYY